MYVRSGIDVSSAQYRQVLEGLKQNFRGCSQKGICCYCLSSESPEGRGIRKKRHIQEGRMAVWLQLPHRLETDRKTFRTQACSRSYHAAIVSRVVSNEYWCNGLTVNEYQVTREFNYSTEEVDLHGLGPSCMKLRTCTYLVICSTLFWVVNFHQEGSTKIFEVHAKLKWIGPEGLGAGMLRFGVILMHSHVSENRKGRELASTGLKNF